MTKTQKKTMGIVAKRGFTFIGDSHFSTYTQAVRALNGLVKMGYLDRVIDSDGRCEYTITPSGAGV